MADKISEKTLTPLERTFERKVRLSSWALFFERLWPRLWLALGIAIIFAALSLAGVWPLVPEIFHKLSVALIAAAILAALVYAVRVPWPHRDEAVRRIERRSGVAHRPASSYEDNVTAFSDNPETAALWSAHKERLARAIERLKVGNPSPRADRFDKFALRALAVLALIPAALLVHGSLGDRLASAFRFGKPIPGNETRVDAWVTPPPYTSLPPIMLADGAQPAAVPVDDGKAVHKPLIGIPERSLMTLRGTGFKNDAIAIEVFSEGSKEPVRTVADPPKGKNDAAEVRLEIRKSARVRALAGSVELGQWTFDVTPDLPPKITLDKNIERTPKGSLKLAYKAEDDYGVASAAAKLSQLRLKPGDGGPRAWAMPAPVKGPRLPLERPPELSLKLSRTGAKAVEGTTLLELGAHPWAGQRVALRLEATDVGGQIGRNEPVEIVLPARRFAKPLARAVIEQRRKLAEDSRNRPLVARSLDALTLEPEGFITSSSIFIGLRTVYHRLEHEKSRAAITSSINQLWSLALKIEDGALADAEASLKDVQDRLSKALEQGADDKDIQDLIQELRQALNKYLEEMQKTAEDETAPESQDPNQQQTSQQDLDKMMQELEKNAKNGSREEAEKMLAELRELMEKLQSGKSKEAQENDKKAKEAMKKLNALSDLAGKQRKLMDDTFKEQNKPGGDKPGGEDGQSGEDQQGDPKPGQKGQQGKSAQGKKGQPGKNGEPGQGKKQPGEASALLRDRQSGLRKDLDELKKELGEMGAGDPEKLAQAQNAMKQAEDAIEKGDMDNATEQQSQALEQMRQTAQQMSEQMSKQNQKRLGRGDSPRDPLDRPQRSEGPDLGNSVKVPNAIDAQRAREILDELRRRSGEALRPPTELDYIERLLRKF